MVKEKIARMEKNTEKEVDKMEGSDLFMEEPRTAAEAGPDDGAQAVSGRKTGPEGMFLEKADEFLAKAMEEPLTEFLPGGGVDAVMEEISEDEAVDEEDEEAQGLYEHFRVQADPGQAPLRLDKFLVDRLQKTARNRIQNAAKAGNILVNGKAEKSNYKVKPGDVVSLVLPNPPQHVDLAPENIPVDIVYEDADLLVVDKAPGMVVHPGFGNFTGTLVNALMYHLKGEKPYLVHRIDKDTSGLLLVAKTEEAQTYLAKQFFEHTTERCYRALVWGNFPEEEGTITGNIARSVQDRKVMAVYPEGDKGKHAVTHYKVRERFGYVTLVDCILETGRTHQIRCHMRYIKHPLFNDAAYGGDRILKGTTFSKYKQFVENCFSLLPRQALHAATLGFVHPRTGQRLHFESPMPADMETVLEKWRIYSKNRELEEEVALTAKELREKEKLMNLKK